MNFVLASDFVYTRHVKCMRLWATVHAGGIPVFFIFDSTSITQRTLQTVCLNL